jgi:hypothetical protein
MTIEVMTKRVQFGLMLITLAVIGFLFLVIAKAQGTNEPAIECHHCVEPRIVTKQFALLCLELPELVESLRAEKYLNLNVIVRDDETVGDAVCEVIAHK